MTDERETQRFGVVDAALPKDMARRAERTGAGKAEQDVWSLLALATLAGAYIAFGATFAAVVATGDAIPLGYAKLLGGLAFSLAYVLAIVGGAELFTTNVLMVMAWVHRRLSTRRLLRAWSIVFVGNFIGAVATGAMLALAGIPGEYDGAVAIALLESADRLAGLGFIQALFLGILGNTLLCLGVWLTYSGTSTTDRILALTPPVAAFYALGLEHSVAVMFYLPMAWTIEALEGSSAWLTSSDFARITVGDFFSVLAPVTVGNIIGGGVLVALMYWFVYLRSDPDRG